MADDDGYEVICPGCRQPVASSAVSCPHCDQVLIGSAKPPPVVTTWAAEAPVTPPAVVRRQVDDLGAARGYGGYGGFWIRVGAYLIDALLLAIPTIALERAFGEVAGLPISLAVDWLYFALMESSTMQGTVGKTLCGLAVTDLDGRRISFARATARYFAKFLSAFTLGIGFLLVALTPRKRGLHDLLAGTTVIRD